MLLLLTYNSKAIAEEKRNPTVVINAANIIVIDVDDERTHNLGGERADPGGSHIIIKTAGDQMHNLFVKESPYEIIKQYHSENQHRNVTHWNHQHR